MTFAHWPVLLLLFVPLAMLVGIWRRDQPRVVLPLDYGLQSAGRGWEWLVNTFQSAGPMLLGVAIVLVAGPRHLSVPKEERVLTNIEICLDVSGSMSTKFGQGTRHDGAMEAINRFVDEREGDAFGLTLCSDIAVPWIPLTKEPSAFKCAAPFVRPEHMWRSLGGGTMLGVGLRKCQEHLLQREEGDRIIILVSDGVSWDLDQGVNEVIGRELRDNQITVYYVHIADDDAPPTTAAIATITGGATFAAGNEAALANVFQRIDEMQRTRLERSLAEIQDYHWPFCLAGFVFGTATLIGFGGLRYTPW